MNNPRAIPLTPELLVAQQIARVVGRGDDPASRVQDTLRILSLSLGLDRPRVLLVDPEFGGLAIRYAHGLTAADLTGGGCRIGEGVSGQVFATGQTALAHDVADEPAYCAQTLDRSAVPGGQIAFLAVAIIRDHAAIGVLGALRLHNCERPFQSDLALLEVIAAFIGQLLITADAGTPPAARQWSAPVDLAPAEAGPVTAVDDPAAARRELMLRTAQDWHRSGHLHQATDLFLQVLRRHPHSSEAQTAHSATLKIARGYEAAGFRRLAMGVVERLERATQHAGNASGSGFSPGGGTAQDPPWGRDQDGSWADGSDYSTGLYKSFRRGAS